MNNSWLEKDVRPTFPAAEKLDWGDVCVADADGALVKWTEAADGAAALFFALDSADPADETKKRVAVLVAGVSPSTVLANAVAGTYATGAPVYAAAGGKVAPTGTRKVGVYLDAPVELESEGKLHVAPVYAPADSGTADGNT